ncbi:MAG TPA: phosphatase PAP2 family protein, partial [Vicinamibacterales bacterium]
DGSKGNPGRSYPSGHATLSYSVGPVLARLMPAKAGAIMARAQDYALSRQICGVHFPSDTEASHALGSMVSTRLLFDPSMQPKLDAARAELARAGQ